MSVQITDTIELIEKYKESGDITFRNDIIMKYSGLVKHIAISTRNMYMKYAEIEDIVNEGIISLIAAVESFDFGRNVKFETYASLKIRGAIIDFVRKQDFIPRNVRHFSRELEAAYSNLYSRLKREPTNAELADELNISEEKLNKLMGEAASASTLSFEELLYENNLEQSEQSVSGEWEAEKGIFKRELYSVLADAIESLNEKERYVISMYYYEKLKFSDIGKIMGITESRVCQIHSKAVVKLKYNINEYLNP
ncbi:MAG: FliA/WhiG family RNA polymerase sigma factor [Oscillospiraceae bacterium]|jgi:RNA polymerase sigma factor for flagellar operon FliA